MDTRGDLLFVLVLISSGLVSGNQWILGGGGEIRDAGEGQGRAGQGSAAWGGPLELRLF